MAPENLKETGLVYVSDSEPGIRRQRTGRSFCYRLPDGSLVRDAALKARISALGLPPAYENVWICIEANGHLRATGFDSRGRKQYRYHVDWQRLKSGDKFAQLIAFGRALPRLRRAVRRDLDEMPGTIGTMLAAITVLLDEAQLRVGNRSYAEENKTYGATTLLKRHVSLAEGAIELRITAKGGKRVRRMLKHPRLQRLLEECADLPGRQLFVWKDEAEQVRPVDSGRLNTYLADISGVGVSAKAGSGLERYAAVFNGVEINSTFYRHHQKKTFVRWASAVPAHFLFAVKIPREITHEARLRNIGPLFDVFVDEISVLEGKLGPLLCQMPPSLRFDAAEAEEAFSAIRGNKWNNCSPLPFAF